MPSIEIKNLTITKLKDKNLNSYYIIKDNITQEAYFCFQKPLKEVWAKLEQNYQNIKELEIEYLPSEKGNRVVNLSGFLDEFSDEFFL